MFDAVAQDMPFKSGDRVAIMVNGLGGTPITELYVLYRRAARSRREGRLRPSCATTSANTAPALEMAGASLTILRLDDELEKLLAAPAESAARIF